MNIHNVAYDNAKTLNSIAQEQAFERKAEKMLAGYREFPNGRDFRCFRERDRTDKNNDEFNDAFDSVFPDAPGSPGWFEKRFGG